MSSWRSKFHREQRTLAWLEDRESAVTPSRGSDNSPSRLARSSIENPSVPLTAAEALLGDSRTEAGISVTHNSCLRLAPVWQAVSLISGDLAKIPLITYKRDKAQGRLVDRRHQAYTLLRWKANQEQTAFFFWRVIWVHALIWNHAFAYIQRDGGYRPLELIPLLPDRTFPTRRNGVLWIATEINKQIKFVRPDDVLHIKGISLDGLDGCDLLEKARNSFAVGLAAQKFASKFFANGANAGGVLQHPGKLSPKAEKNLQDSFEDKHVGLDRAHRVILMEEGMKFIRTQIAPDEGQMLESRKEQVKEVARWFNLSPDKLGDDSNDGYNGLEQKHQAYLDSTLDPWLQSASTEAREKLLTEEQKRKESHAIEHDTRAFLRSDSASRMAYYKGMMELGAMDSDYVASSENLPPPGDTGKQLYISSALTPIGLDPNNTSGETPDDDPPEPAVTGKMPMVEDPMDNPPPDDPSPDDNRAAVPRPTAPALKTAIRLSLHDALLRAQKRLTVQAVKAAARPATFLTALYGLGSHRDACAAILTAQAGVYRAVQPTHGDRKYLADHWADILLARTRQHLLEAAGRVTAEGLAQEVAAVCDRLLATEPLALATELAEQL